MIYLIYHIVAIIYNNCNLWIYYKDWIFVRKVKLFVHTFSGTFQMSLRFSNQTNCNSCGFSVQIEQLRNRGLHWPAFGIFIIARFVLIATWESTLVRATLELSDQN